MYRAVSLLCVLVAAGACRSEAKGAEPTEPAVSARKAADMLHAVMAADRAVYTRHVVNRLTVEQTALKASEEWKSEPGTLPLPAQMFRMGAEAVNDSDAGFHYVLLSPWPVNKKNAPKTDTERAGLDAVVANRGKEPFYATETLGGTRYFTAVYADVAVAEACVRCHNEHRDSPRHDFAIGDVMGGVVIRMPLN